MQHQAKPMRLLLLPALLLELVLGANIYWKNTSSMNTDKVALVLVQSDDPPHQIELVTNTENKAGGWKKVWGSTVNYNEFKYVMPPDMKQGRYYAFKLEEDGCAHYTKPMYLSKEGRWMDPDTESESINNDGKKNENAAPACVVFGAFVSLLAAQALL